jgi:CrcB protein
MLPVAIFVGAGLGGLARYAVGGWVQGVAGAGFPWGTLLVNVTGSLLLGFLLRYALATEAVSPEVRLLLTTGFCGGYTTFSTFSYETAALIEDGQYDRAALYVVLSVVASLVGTFVGIAGARELIAFRERL